MKREQAASQKNTENLRLEADISEHVAYVFREYLSKNYDGSNVNDKEIARIDHGITHATRTAIYATIFANLYRRYGDKDAISLQDEDIKLIQIAALFHDVGRAGDGVDRIEWEQKGCIELYKYLCKLGVNHDKAKLLAEAARNKDLVEDYDELIIQDDKYEWKKSTRKHKNIYQKLIHDADSLDIMRVRGKYQAKYLDFYNEIIYNSSKQVDTNALDDLSCLIVEARSLIDLHGDSVYASRRNIATKKKYEHENAYKSIMESIVTENYPNKLRPYPNIISLYADGKLVPLDTLRQIIISDPCEFKDLVFCRGIVTPSAIRKTDKEKARGPETLVQVEFRKAGRTLESKGKVGNPYRSVSLLGHGSIPFLPVGFLIINPDINAITKISNSTINSGVGKKKKWANEPERKSSTIEKNKKLNDLVIEQKMGNLSSGKGTQSTASEILYDITRFDGVYFTRDPITDIPFMHQHAVVLQAIYSRSEFAIMHKKKIPIIEYSGIHNFHHERKYRPDEIKNMWIEMCTDFIRKVLEQNLEIAHYSEDIFSMSTAEIKTIAMYGWRVFDVAKENAPADANYPNEFRDEITAAIEAKRDELIEEYRTKLMPVLKQNMKKKIEENRLQLFKQQMRERSSIAEKLYKIAVSINEIDFISQIQDLAKDKVISDLKLISPVDFEENYKKLKAIIEFSNSFNLLTDVKFKKNIDDVFERLLTTAEKKDDFNMYKTQRVYQGLFDRGNTVFVKSIAELFYSIAKALNSSKETLDQLQESVIKGKQLALEELAKDLHGENSYFNSFDDLEKSLNEPGMYCIMPNEDMNGLNVFYKLPTSNILQGVELPIDLENKCIKAGGVNYGDINKFMNESNYFMQIKKDNNVSEFKPTKLVTRNFKF